MTLYIERVWQQTQYLVIGVDEVGRGPLAGPVVAAGARFKGNQLQLNKTLKRLENLNVTDSKKLTSKKRQYILESLGVDLGNVTNRSHLIINELDSAIELFIFECDEKIIDSINILQASLLAMKTCAESLANKEKAKVIFDGNRIPSNIASYLDCEFLIKGDSKSLLIALASIFAKEYRDLLMTKYSRLYPGYGFEKHSGYPTKFHREAIKSRGVTEIHRKSFKGVSEFL